MDRQTDILTNSKPMWMIFKFYNIFYKIRPWFCSGDKNITYALVCKRYGIVNISRHYMLAIRVAKVQFTNLVNKIGKMMLIFCFTKPKATKSITNFCHPKNRHQSYHDFFRLKHSFKPKPENLL